MKAVKDKHGHGYKLRIKRQIISVEVGSKRDKFSSSILLMYSILPGQLRPILFWQGKNTYNAKASSTIPIFSINLRNVTYQNITTTTIVRSSKCLIFILEQSGRIFASKEEAKNFLHTFLESSITLHCSRMQIKCKYALLQNLPAPSVFCIIFMHAFALCSSDMHHPSLAPLNTLGNLYPLTTVSGSSKLYNCVYP